jgi:hypothetical protein
MSAGAAAVRPAGPRPGSSNDEDRDRRFSQGFLHGASKKGRGDPSATPVSQDEQVVSAGGLTAQGRTWSAAEEKGPFAGMSTAPLAEAAGEVIEQRGSQAPGRPPKKVAPLFRDGGLDVGKSSDVGDGNRSARGSGEDAGRVERSPGLGREIDARENPEPRTRQGALQSARRGAGGPRLASVSVAVRKAPDGTRGE